ncbi:MAG: flagellar capping protein [Anaerocolumna sp.]|jgi:flagellar hook-associated protein 2|nr:flagellar capping protein [Anaerocolumna sp.]
MANNISNALNSRLRLTGMASGLDTESMIKQLMKAEQYKVDRVKQEKQALQWKRDDYRSMTSLLKGFSDSYMNVLSSSDMMSPNSYKAFSVTSANSAVATATANADAVAGTHDIAVTQLAKAAYAVGTDTVSAALQGTAIDAATLASITGKDFNITLNGITKNIKLTGDYTDPATALANLKIELDTKITAAFGSGKIAVEISADNKLSFSSADSKIALTSGTSDALAQLGMVSGSTNRLNLLAKLSTSTEFRINGISFTADTTKTMKDVINEVNSSTAGVTLSYSEATDKFTLTSKVKGAGDAIVVEQKDINGNFVNDISLLGIKTADIKPGQDAKLIYDGTAITRNDNTFTLDGIKFNLLAVSQLVDANDPTKGLVKTSITLDQDVDKVFKNILSFVDKYNELVGKLNGELGEARDKDYQPLTEDQKESMSETDIKTWEAKARSGMLRNDSLLNGVLNEMRSAIYASIEGISEGVFSIGIKTGDYTQKGKLIIDETKLKDAIKNKPDLVANIFNKVSDINYSINLSSADKTTRYKQSGIVNRLYDIIQKNITTLRNDKGQKGLLIEKAGYSEDYIDISSYISKQIKDKDTQIDTLIERLQNKEDSYYRKFAAMEKAMSQMNSQSSWISQQFGGGQ